MSRSHPSLYNPEFKMHENRSYNQFDPDYDPDASLAAAHAATKAYCARQDAESDAKYRREMQIGLGVFALATIICIAAALLINWAQFSAASSAAAQRSVEGLGYNSVQILDKQMTNGLGAWVGCDVADNAKFIVTATSDDGNTVSMYVCVSGDRATVHF